MRHPISNLVVAERLLSLAKSLVAEDHQNSWLEFLMDRVADPPERAQAGATTAKMVLEDFRATYAPAVAKAYAARPRLQPEAAGSWKAAAEFIDKQFRQSETRVRVEFTSTDPYKSRDQMADEVKRTGVLKIWTGESDSHPVWTPEQNWKFRAVHDYQAHISGGLQFSLRGEIGSYNRQVKTFPKAAHACMFTEIVGQACYQAVHGSFPGNKVAFLYGFDYEKVGLMDVEAYKLNFSKPAPN